jgi:hypothetical protein
VKSIGAIAAALAKALQSQLSAVLRGQLLEELTEIGSADEGVAWAQRRLEAKNTLASADADLVEQAFRKKMASLEAPDGAANPNPDGAGQANELDQAGDQKSFHSQGPLTRENEISSSLPKRVAVVNCSSAPPFLKLARKRDKAHRQFVCSQPCLICGRRPSDAHHLQFGQRRALGRRVSDEFIVPLCRVHHRDLHRRSDERAWWQK